jgi:hypothetical protein
VAVRWRGKTTYCGCGDGSESGGWESVRISEALSSARLSWVGGQKFLIGDFAWHFLPWSRLVGGQGLSSGDFA